MNGNKNNFYYYLKYVLLASILFLLIKSRLELYILVNKGISTEGYVTNVRNVGSKGTIKTEYVFYVDGVKYESSSTNVNNLHGSNLIKIIYYPLFPSINHPFEHLEQFK